MARILIIAEHAQSLYSTRLDLLQDLLLEGHQVDVLVPRDEFSDRLADLGCRVSDVTMARRSTNPLSDLPLLASYFRVMRQGYDLVIAYSIKPNIYGGLVARLLSIPFIANITGLGSAYYRRSLVRYIITVLYRLSVYHARAVLFENAANRDALVAHRCVRHEATVVMAGAGVNVEYFHPAPYPQDEPVRYLFIGRIMREKGVFELLECARRFASARLNAVFELAGYCERDGEDAEGAFRGSNVRYSCFVSDVRPLIARAHCIVLPSYHEGMANALLEAGAMGRPLIATDIPGCREAVQDGASGFLCKATDADDLHRTLLAFQRLDPAARERMGDAARRHVTTHFNKRDVVANTLAVINGILEGESCLVALR